MTKNIAIPLKKLLQGLDVDVKGNSDISIAGVCTINSSKPEHITFLANSAYRKYLETTTAAAVILPDTETSTVANGVTAIYCKNPLFVYAKIAECFNAQSSSVSGIHPTAVIGHHCAIDSSAAIGPHVVIEDNVTIGAGVVIGARCFIGADSVLGANCRLEANVTLYHHSKLGDRVHLASGVVIGSDGFGFANEKGTWVTIPQLGAVRIGHDVSIGANTTIDRGAIDDTIIEDGVKLDNLIQVGHNVQIGAHTIIAGCTAIAGSTVIGKYCMIGGGSCFAGHITVCDKVMITGMSAVTKSVREPGMYSSGIVGVVPNHEFRKNNARFHRLENLMQRVKNLESTIKALTESNQT